MTDFDWIRPNWDEIVPTLGGKCCPSSADWNVRYIIGRRKEDGTIQFTKDLIPAGPEVMGHVRLVGDDYAYRFGGSCVQDACAHWANGCDLGATITKVAIEKKLKPRDPCAFKTLCRWYAENGANACGGCAYISRGIVKSVDQRDTEKSSNGLPWFSDDYDDDWDDEDF